MSEPSPAAPALVPGLNALLPQFEKIMAPDYVAAYNEHVVGRILAHQRPIEENRADPVIVGFGGEKGPEVGKIEEIHIPVAGNEKILLRIYRPTATPSTTTLPPVHINFHGGGWVIGRAGDDDAYIRTMVVATGAVVIDVDYRVAPEYRYPIPLEDCWTAFEYVCAHAKELGVDAEKMSLGGFSAGGHITAFIAQRARDRGVSGGIKLCIMVIPVTDASCLGLDLEPVKDCKHQSWITNYDAPFLGHPRMSYFYKYFLPEKFTTETLLEPTLSPLLHPNFKGLPPTLVVTAEIDVLMSEGIAYAERLQKDGDGWVKQWTAKGVPHPFPQQTAITDKAREFYKLSIETMKEAYAGKLVREA